MAKKLSIDNVSALWLARHTTNVRTQEQVAKETLDTMKLMIGENLSREAFMVKAFIEKATNWPQHEKDAGGAKKGDWKGLNKAIEAEVDEAFAWDACRKQLAKYKFDKDGDPITDKKGNPVLKPEQKGFKASTDQVKRAKAVNIPTAEVKACKSNLSLELLIEKQATAFKLQQVFDSLRPSMSKPTLEMFMTFFEQAGISMEVSDTKLKMTTTKIEKEIAETEGEAEKVETVADVKANMEMFEQFMKFQQMQKAANG